MQALSSSALASFSAVPVPIATKAAGEANQRANLEAASLRLDDEDRRAIAGLPKDRRLVDPDFAPDWNA